jgi:C4-dicarboxylate-binding protein DctP
MKILKVLSAYLISMFIAFVPLTSAKAEQPTKEKPLVLKISHETPAGQISAKSMSSDKLKQLIEARTEGRVKVEIHPGGELYKDPDGLMAAARGIIFCQQASLDVLTEWEPGFEVTCLYGLYTDEEHFVRFLNHKSGGKELIKRLEKKGLTGDIYLSNPWRLWTKVKVTKVEQLKGMPIRTSPAKVEAKAMEALGCRVFSMTAGEIYTAAQTGMIDGVVTLPLAVGGRKLDDIFKFCVIKPAFKQNGVMMALSKMQLDRMPSDIRNIIDKSLPEVCEATTEYSKKLDQDWINKLKARGVTFLSLEPAEWREFDAKFKVVREGYRKVLGNLMDMAEKTR